ncbi:3108_t:CDS:2, partial [Racocetra persica]
MSVVGWTKLTLNELRDLCLSCGLDTLGNKDELGERLNTHFDKKKGKLPLNLNDADIEGDFVSKNEESLELESYLGSEYNFRKQAGSTSGISHLRNKDPSKKNNQHVAEEGKRVIKKMDAVPVDVFLSALNNIERKIDYNFEALQDQHFKETEQKSLLSKAWPRVKLEKPYDKYEYDFLIGVGKQLDKAIGRLSEYDQKEFIAIREEIESCAVTLQLVNDRGWKVALQVVGGNDKMMQKYKDQIGMVTSALPSIGANTWNYSRKFFKRNYRKSQIKRKYRVESASTSSESESEERNANKIELERGQCRAIGSGKDSSNFISSVLTPKNQALAGNFGLVKVWSTALVKRGYAFSSKTKSEAVSDYYRTDR